jgi:copper chaperone
MVQFSVPDMTCGHCASTITKAVRSEDPRARVEISLGEHLVKVQSELPEDEIAQCISEAGYTPEALAR